MAKPYGGPKGAREKLLIMRTRPPTRAEGAGASILESPPPPSPPRLRTETSAHVSCFSRTAQGQHCPANLEEGRLTHEASSPRPVEVPGSAGTDSGNATPCAGRLDRARLFHLPLDVSAPSNGLAKAGDPIAIPEEHVFSKRRTNQVHRKYLTVTGDGGRHHTVTRTLSQS